MTAIVIHDGVLYGDRKVLKRAFPVTFQEGTKIYTSKDRQFAYGISGNIPRPEFRPVLEAKVRQLLELILGTPAGKRGDDIDLDEEHSMKGVIEGGIIFCTTDQVFRSTSVMDSLAEITEFTSGMGTGGTFIVGMIEAGMSPKDAYAAINPMDPLTGPIADTIKQSSLKPFVIRGVSGK